MINFLKRFGPLLVLAGLVAAAFASGLTKHLTLDELRANHEALTAFVAANRWLALAAFMGLYVAVTALSLPGALFMTLAAGLLFGPWLGGAAALVSATTGASIVFLICRTAFGGTLAKRAGSGLARIEAEKAPAAEAALATDQMPIHPLRLCREVRDFLPRDAILCVDGQEILNYGRQSIPTHTPGHRLNSGPFGIMGVGLPFGLARDTGPTGGPAPYSRPVAPLPARTPPTWGNIRDQYEVPCRTLLANGTLKSWLHLGRWTIPQV